MNMKNIAAPAGRNSAMTSALVTPTFSITIPEPAATNPNRPIIIGTTMNTNDASTKEGMIDFSLIANAR